MNQLIDNIIVAWQAQSNLEIIAVISALLYLILLVKENIYCWLFAFASTAIYIYLFYSVSLLSTSALNIFYLVMAVYGFIKWRNKNKQHELKISTWTGRKHLIAISLTGLLVPILGMYMESKGASFPYLDALISCFAVLATFMVAHKILENWHYWFVIDSLSIYLFWQKELYLTGVLFGLYLILIIIGYKQWTKSHAEQ
ncbi:MAG: nicotinamide riboside transporter PnuC [Proteobacteria bacterium]|nr:nicotinamide riboside transporter PnuC [Pseudomonadota bacterium]